MKLNVNFKRNKPELSEDARKAISLLYLEEALYKEQYEECAGLIQTAQGFGAEPSEVSKVIAKHLKSLKYGFKKPKRSETNEPRSSSAPVRRF